MPSEHEVLLHCDIVAGNVIVEDGTARLIDWQCPGRGDPCEDIASFLSPAMQLLYRGKILSAQEISEFFDAYPTHQPRYEALAAAYHFRMAAYCQWQIEQGQNDYVAGLEAELAALTVGSEAV